MADEPVFDEHVYEDWLANRRAAEPSRDLTKQVMAAVEDRDVHRKEDAGREGYVRLAQRMDGSRLARCAACLAAVLVGSLPFLFVAHAAYLFVL